MNTRNLNEKGEVLFNCSSLGNLMTQPRGKSNLQIYNEEAQKLQKFTEDLKDLAAKEAEVIKFKQGQIAAEGEKHKKYTAELSEMQDKTAVKAVKKKDQIEKTAEVWNKRKAELVDLKETLKQKREEKQKQIEIQEKKVEEASVVKDEIQLSTTCMHELRKLANWILWGRREDVQTWQMRHGTEQQEAGVTLFAYIRGEQYTSNRERENDDYLTGEWDIEAFEEKSKWWGRDSAGNWIYDIKVRSTLESFSKKQIKDDNDKSDECQVRGYCRIKKYDFGAIVNVLINLSEVAIQDRLRAEERLWAEGETVLSTVPEWRRIEIIKDFTFDFETFFERVINHVGVITTEEGQDMFDSFIEIPEENRIHVVSQRRDLEWEEEMKTQLDKCRIVLHNKWGVGNIDYLKLDRV